MSSYPDLDSFGIRYMRLSFHLGGGIETVDSFWESHGLDHSKERLLFSGYMRKGKPHTVSIRWARSHDTCCDVTIGVEVCGPLVAWPRRQQKDHKLREKDLLEFIELAGTMPVETGIHAKYAYPRANGWSPFPLSLPPRARLKRVSLEIFDDKGKRAMTLTHEKVGAEWIAIVEPAQRFPFPTARSFFSEPYEVARSFSKSLG